MSARELSEWAAFFALEPFGYQAGLHGSAVVASTIANVNRRKGQRAFKPADFLPDETQEAGKQKDFIGALKAHFRSFGGNDRRPAG